MQYHIYTHTNYANFFFIFLRSYLFSTTDHSIKIYKSLSVHQLHTKITTDFYDADKNRDIENHKSLLYILFNSCIYVLLFYFSLNNLCALKWTCNYIFVNVSCHEIRNRKRYINLKTLLDFFTSQANFEVHTT